MLDRFSRLTWWATGFLGFSGVFVLNAFERSRLFGWCAIVLLGLLPLLIAISRLSSATVGRELLRGSLQLNVAVNSVPSYSGSIRVYPSMNPNARASGLRHFLYNNEDCIGAVASIVASLYPIDDLERGATGRR